MSRLLTRRVLISSRNIHACSIFNLAQIEAYALKFGQHMIRLYFEVSKYNMFSYSAIEKQCLTFVGNSLKI